MAIKLVEINKISGNVYSVTAEDTDDQIGTDESGSPIYRQYSARYNINTDAKSVVDSLKAKMKEKKTLDMDNSSVETKIKVAVEAIDIAKV
jgi:hypothetical protein